MSILNQILEKAKADPRHIILAEGEDPRIAAAAVRALKDGIAAITLIGDVAKVRTLTRKFGDEDDDINVLNPGDEHPLYFANDRVMRGKADGSVAGAVYTTPDVVRAGLKIIGVHSDFKIVSSFFIMILPESSEHLRGGVIYSDCGLVVAPSPEQLAEIASASSKSGRALLGLDPKVAMLSFATRDSAQHDYVDKTKAATKILKAARPDLSIDGPLQFDAAILPSIADRKAPGSDIGGQANVFIFPDLNAGNIAYKITERLGGAKAIGPILQGLKKPANDLSRGCDADAVYNMIAVTVLQAQQI